MLLKSLFTSLLLFIFQTGLFCTPYKMAICTLIKNEAPWVSDWIEYHRQLGVEHFYLYEDGSTDNTLEVLKPYVEKGIVEVIPWATLPDHVALRDNRFDTYQMKAFNNCIHRCNGIVEWLAILDIHEYIFPTQHRDSLISLLDRESRKRTGTVALYRVIFDNDVAEIPNDQQVAGNKHPSNAFTKCIHKPEAIKNGLDHEDYLKPGYTYKVLRPSFYRVNFYGKEDRTSW